MEKDKLKKGFGKFLQFFVPVVIGVGLFYFLCKNVDIDQMKEIMRSEINYWWIGAALIISVFSHVFRALRWRLQLRALGVRPSTSALINSIFGTYAVNLIFPRLGEVWRSGYIADREKVSFTKVLGSMVGDRLSDTFTVLFLTFITFFLAQSAFISFLDTYPQAKDGIYNMLTSPLIWALGVIGIAALVALFTVKTSNKFVLKIRTLVSNLWNGFIVVAKMDGKWWFLFYTILIWGFYFTQLYVATFAFSYTASLGLIPTLVIFVLSSISMGIPTNGGLGAWHIAVIFGLSLYGVGTNFNPAGPFDASASTFAMVVWGAQTLLLIVLGIYAFVSMAIDRSRIKAGITKIESDSDGDGMSL